MKLSRQQKFNKETCTDRLDDKTRLNKNLLSLLCYGNYCIIKYVKHTQNQNVVAHCLRNIGVVKESFTPQSDKFMIRSTSSSSAVKANNMKQSGNYIMECHHISW